MDVEARSTMPSLELASSGLRVACPISFAGAVPVHCRDQRDAAGPARARHAAVCRLLGFRAQAQGDRPEPTELLRELVAKLADGLVDKLMDTQNDLVGDTAPMASMDLPSGSGFIRDSLSFGTNSASANLNYYFIQPEVCPAVRDWLEVKATRTTCAGSAHTS